MNKLMDYIDWRGDIPFQVSPVNELDLAEFTQLCMADFTGIVSAGEDTISLKDAVNAYFEIHNGEKESLGAIQSESALPAMRKLPANARYSDIGMHYHVNKISQKGGEQFSATTLELTDDVMCVIFRGTDDTIIGWKEDFYFAIYPQVPAQKDAKEYLAGVLEKTDKKVIVAGHSKGGNLAVYAAAAVEECLQEKISAVYNFDGPGFNDEFISSEGYKRIKNRTYTMLTNNSLVGVLLCAPGHKLINHVPMLGMAAHDCYNWETGRTHFIRTSKLSPASIKFRDTMKSTIAAMGQKELKDFADELFDIILATGAVTVTDLTRLSINQKMEMLIKIGRHPNIEAFASALRKYLLKPNSQ